LSLHKGYIDSMKSKLIQVRVDPSQAHQFKARADNLGMTLSAYVRYLFERDTINDSSIENLLAHTKKIHERVEKLLIDRGVKVD